MPNFCPDLGDRSPCILMTILALTSAILCPTSVEAAPWFLPASVCRAKRKSLILTPFNDDDDHF